APPPPGADAITVATGSRLAYIKLPASGGKRGTPVIFLHGGPGVAEMDSDADYLSRIAAGGRDVWLYDQLGAGRSERLDDPRGYTLARAVADLEAFRAAIGAERVDLLGYSWGSTLAAAYLAAHADHVERVVFASPGRMIGGTSNLFDLLGRLDAAHLWDVLRFALEPRAFMTWILVQVNPLAAHAFTGDPAMDAQLRKILAALTPALYCRPPAEPDRTDPGFYANEMLLKPRAWRDIDPHDALRQLAIPALVIKGSCDYLSWPSATDYRDTMPQARMVYLQGAGHRAYAERPDIFFALVNAFLNGAPLPVPFETGSKPPPGFEGPVGD
ncbi:MAG TPA: alpha/beta fold hydrolase, partial [Acetobacteraceae bacterium]|nr:alpha/beta fold hydrolase [Acetobacteraceae bacterium]